jgi:myosin heavy subunit
VHGGYDGGAAGVDQTKREIQQMYDDIRNCNSEIEQLQLSFAQNEDIFKQSKNYSEELQKQIQKISAENEKLKMTNSRLQFQSSEAQDLQSEIEAIQVERDNIETQIKNLTSDPFKKKEGEAPSNVSRMQELEMKVKDRNNLARSLKEEENKKSEIVAKAKLELHKLMGEREALMGQHKVASEEFKSKHGQPMARAPDSVDAMNAINNVDSRAYNQMMNDLSMGGVNTSAAPAWADLNFLERLPAQANAGDEKAILQDEITNLQHEKSTFAQELEKAQNLLRLQQDIDKENTHDF